MDNTASNQCYKCEQKLFGNLNIEHNSYNSMTVLWNRYQIFIYEDFNFITPAKVVIPEYQVHHLLITNNYLLCLDTNGFVHLTSLKFKNPTQKLFKCSYQPREQGIKTCITYSQEHALSVKYDSEYFLCLNRISPDYHEVKKVSLSYEDPWHIQENSQGKHILTYHKIDEGNSGFCKKIFKLTKIGSNSIFIVLSFDKLAVYGCLFDPKLLEDKANLVKLFSCPSEISSIGISTDSNLVIGLKMGTVIQITLKDTGTNIKPQIAHLNTALHKLIILNSIFLYTDGVALWQAEKVFSDPMFKQLFVKNVNDFQKCGDLIVCTTFTKLIYTFAYEDQRAYLHQKDQEYNSAEELFGNLNNADYLNRIFVEVEKGKKLATKLKVEGLFITAMALTNRQEIVDTVIQSNVTVHNNFEQLIAGSEDFTLTEDISQYFQPDTYHLQIMVKINPNAKGGLPNIITEILSNSDAEFHITISNKVKILKTTSVKVSKTNVLIPVQLSSTEVTVNLRLVPIIPGTYDKKQKIWPELYKKTIKLSSEHFIRPSVNKTLIHQKSEMDLSKAILRCNEQYITHFDFTDTSKCGKLYSMFVRLPESYKHVNIGKHFSDNNNSRFLSQLLSSEDFLESKCNVSFLVGKETVHIAIDNDGFSSPRLMLSSENPLITTSMRNFFSNIVYAENTCKPGQDFMNNNFYTTVENLEKAVRECIRTSASYEEFSPLMEQFEKDIIGLLPV